MKKAYRLPTLLLVLLAAAQQPNRSVTGYDDTPLLPDGKWKVHDSKRPAARVVTPGTFSTQEAPGKPPADALVLFDGKDLSRWSTGKGEPAKWKVENGYMEVTAKGGDIQTRDEFGDMQLHVEWSSPSPPRGEGQDRGNSGVFLFGQYEIQVLDSFQTRTYSDGHAGSIYGQYPPLVNAVRPPGEWQVFDILFKAPRFKDGKLDRPAYVTVLVNGVVVHNHTQILGDTRHRTLPEYTVHGPKGPIRLQDHSHPVRYRNIWVREIKAYDEP